MLAEGLHVVWPAGAEDVVALLAADKVPGIPRDPDTLADILLERGLARPAAGAATRTQRYWRLAPAPLARDGQVVTLSMLRLASPELVLAGAPPAAVGLADASEPVTWTPGTETPAEPSAGEGREKTGGQVEEGTSHAGATPPSAVTPRPLKTREHETLRYQRRKPLAHRRRRILTSSQRTRERKHEPPRQWRGRGPTRTTNAEKRSPRPLPGSAPVVPAGRRCSPWPRILSGDPSAWDQRIRRKGEQLVVLFPDGLAGLGATPQASLDALAQNGLLDVNPLAPLRRVIEIDGQARRAPDPGGLPPRFSP